MGALRKPTRDERHLRGFALVPPTPQRSRIMAAIKGKGTAPERALGRALRALGLRPVAQDRRRPGRPDFAFPSARVAVFVDGDFWHGRRGIPKTNAEWWAAKFEATRRRDARNNLELAALGWIVFRFGEAADFAEAARLVADAVRAVKEARA